MPFFFPFLHLSLDILTFLFPEVNKKRKYIEVFNITPATTKAIYTSAILGNRKRSHFALLRNKISPPALQQGEIKYLSCFHFICPLLEDPRKCRLAMRASSSICTNHRIFCSQLYLEFFIWIIYLGQGISNMWRDSLFPTKRYRMSSLPSSDM